MADKDDPTLYVPSDNPDGDLIALLDRRDLISSEY